jgi:hypothetical protein
MKTIWYGILILAALSICVGFEDIAAASNVQLNVDNHDPSSEIVFEQRGSLIEVTWPSNDGVQTRMEFDLAPDRPLIASIGTAPRNATMYTSIVESVDPVLFIRVGDRDLDKRSGWTIFFDRMQRKPNEVVQATIEKTSAMASSSPTRAVLTIGGVTAGPFKGELRWTFYSGSPFVLQEAVMQTEKNGVAYLYDTGLAFGQNVPGRMSWRAPLGEWMSEDTETIDSAKPLAVRGRTMGAEFEHGTIALFPPPHRYFYPLDFSDNFKNIWMGPAYENSSLPFAFGIRHDPKGDNRYVPWFNAPPGTEQELGLYLYVSNESAEPTQNDVAQLTRNDRFSPLPGHQVFTSHYHVEHTQQVMNAQNKESDPGAYTTNRLQSGGTYRIPERLQNPGFVRAFRELGIDIVHLAEFHFGETPRWKTAQRLRQLDVLHAECARLSDEDFLLLPGEEPNVHLGGHWISFFPNPVHWVLNRPEGTPFVTTDPKLGNVYHVGSHDDILRLLKEEDGLAWTAHARIKSSTGFPDVQRQQPFFRSDQFLGAAWKAMPADLSQPRLGKRVLDLFDDMSNWGDPKYVLGEVDVFKIEPNHELYAHMNVNYLRLEETPKFENGWQPVLDALRKGAFFVTTGEVLIPEFTINGKRSGETAVLQQDTTATLRLDLDWTFPLSHAQVVSGNGNDIKRRRIDLSATKAFGQLAFELALDLKGQKWVRVEVWDTATNGAFTQPVWIEHH